MGTYTDASGIAWDRHSEPRWADHSYSTWGPGDEAMRVYRAGEGWAATVNGTIVALGSETRMDAMALALAALDR